MKNHVLHEKHEFSSIRQLVEEIGDLYFGKVAFSYRLKATDKDVQTKNYEHLRADVRALGTALIARGLSGKTIALVGKLSYAWVLLYYAVQAVGSVLTPLDRDWTAEDLSDTAKRADAVAVFADEDVAQKGEAVADAIAGTLYTVDGEGENTVSALLAEGEALLTAGDRRYFEGELDTERMSLLVFTSGTTGKGKGVMLSQRAILSDMADVLP